MEREGGIDGEERNRANKQKLTRYRRRRQKRRENKIQEKIRLKRKHNDKDH
jgi:hypothetical protein